MEKSLMRSLEAKKITWFGFWVNGLLTILKIIAGFIGNSGAMLADGVHSLSDFLTDILVIVGFKLTEKPEDECHNYGHNKYETLATAIISIFLAIVGFEIFKSGCASIITVLKGGELQKPGIIALIAAIVSILLKEFLYRITVIVGRRINSSAVIANAWHHRSDAFSSIGTMFGIGGAILLGARWTILDPIASLVVSIFIFKVAYDIFIPAVNELMEASLTNDEKEQIHTILKSHNEIKAFHKLRTRRIGTKVAIEFHIEVDETNDIKKAHNVATHIEKLLSECFHECIVTIHIEPFVKKASL